jgi:hypothetical protein
MAWMPFPLLSVASDIVASPAGDRIAVTSSDPSFSRWGSFPILRIYEYHP